MRGRCARGTRARRVSAERSKTAGDRSASTQVMGCSRDRRRTRYQPDSPSSVRNRPTSPRNESQRSGVNSSRQGVAAAIASAAARRRLLRRSVISVNSGRQRPVADSRLHATGVQAEVAQLREVLRAEVVVIELVAVEPRPHEEVVVGGEGEHGHRAQQDPSSRPAEFGDSTAPLAHAHREEQDTEERRGRCATRRSRDRSARSSARLALRLRSAGRSTRSRTRRRACAAFRARAVDSRCNARPS